MKKEILFIMLLVSFLCVGSSLYAEGPSITMTDPETGETTTITRGADGNNVITRTDADGNTTTVDDPFGPKVTNYDSPNEGSSEGGDPLAGDEYFGEGGALEGMTGGVSVDPETGDKLISVNDDSGERHTWGVNGDGGSNDGAGFLPPDIDGAMRVDPDTGDTYVSLEAGEGSGVISETQTFDPETGMTVITREVSDQVDGGRMAWVRRADGSEESLHHLPSDDAGAVLYEPDGTRHISMDDGQGGRNTWSIDPDGNEFGDDLNSGGTPIGPDVLFDGGGEAADGAHTDHHYPH